MKVSVGMTSGNPNGDPEELKALLSGIKASGGIDSGAMFAKLCEIYSPLIETSAAKYLQSGGLPESEADDLRQEATIALYFAALAYDSENVSEGEVTFGLFAKICVNNRLISFVRKYNAHTGGKKKMSIETDVADKITGDTCDELAESLIRKENARKISAAAESELSEMELAVFRDYISGADIKTISERHGMSVKTVNNALYRLKKKIRRKINQ